MGSDWIIDPILHLVKRSSGIIDPTLGSTDIGYVWFLTYLKTDLQHLKMFIALLCLNGVEWLSLRPIPGTEEPRIRRESLCPKGGRRQQRPPLDPGLIHSRSSH